jgi:hypothetical protein
MENGGFGLAAGRAGPVEDRRRRLRDCEAASLGFMPFAPIGMGGLAGAGGALASVAARHGATPA